MLYTLVTEGSDDRVLMSPIDWLLEQYCGVQFSGQWANPVALDDASRDMTVRMTQVGRYYPADLFFVHRDTDISTREHREDEIRAALEASGCAQPVICVIPVRMTEAWLLFDEDAIRRAADRANGRVGLGLPSVAEVQRRANPKEILESKLVLASELTGRRLAQFRAEMSRRKSLVATNIDDFAPLRRHDSFARMEQDIRSVLAMNGWGLD